MIPAGSRAVRTWNAIGRIAAAHAVMLRDVGLIDDDALAGLLRAADRARLAFPDNKVAGQSLLRTVREFDERMDAQLPAGLAGTGRVGRGTIDVAAGAARLVLRENVLGFGASVEALRATLIELASEHVVSLMPVSLMGQAAQPTTFGHQVAAVVSQLTRASARIESAYVEVNRSPLGSGALASTGMPIDRERLTDLLGFDGLIENTFDAVSATDHFFAVADAADAATVPAERLLDAIMDWIRVEPDSFRFGGDLSTLLSDLPQVRPALGVASLRGALRAVPDASESLRAAQRSAAFGPLTVELDRMLELAHDILDRGSAAIVRATVLFGEGLEVNRALLANRAGKGFSTSSDLADFLMIEEQIEPGPAQQIAALTISRARDQGIEASGITADLIDGAALLVIGREIKVEFEAISRYLAPRRFIARRTVPGGPNPDAVRAHLDGERARLAQDDQRLARAQERLTRAASELDAIEREALASADG